MFFHCQVPARDWVRRRPCCSLLSEHPLLSREEMKKIYRRWQLNVWNRALRIKRLEVSVSLNTLFGAIDTTNEMTNVRLHEDTVNRASSHTTFLFSTAVLTRSVWYLQTFHFYNLPCVPPPLPYQTCFLHTSASYSPYFLGVGTKNSG